MKHLIQKKRRQHTFTVIELILAIAVILVGITSILVLMTAGLLSSQSAIGNTRAADAAQTMISYIKVQAVEADLSGDWVDFLEKFPSQRDDGDDWISGEDTTFQPGDENNIWSEIEEDIYDTDKTFFSTRMPGKDYYLYRIMSKTKMGEEERGGETVDVYSIDFDAIVRIWTTDSIRKYMPKGHQSKTQINKWGANVVAFVMEISWPAEAPYRSREKKVYYFEYQRRQK